MASLGHHLQDSTHIANDVVTAGLTYATKVTSRKVIQFVPRTPHALMSTKEGREAILRAIEQE